MKRIWLQFFGLFAVFLIIIGVATYSFMKISADSAEEGSEVVAAPAQEGEPSEAMPPPFEFVGQSARQMEDFDLIPEIVIKGGKAPEPMAEPTIIEESLTIPEEAFTHEEGTPPTMPTDTRPKIAIVIDDLGLNATRLKAMIDLDIPMTLAFLPYPERVEEQIKSIKDDRYDIFLHMPMQPESKTIDPGKFVLKKDMTEDEIRRMLDAAIAKIPNLKGFNNHMGSAFTQDIEGMKTIIRVAQEKELIFMDSKTISSSVGDKAAKEVGYRILERDIFLDHRQDVDYIVGQLDKMARIAEQNGLVIAIGHPHKETIKAFQKWLTDERREKYNYVTLSRIKP